VLQFLCIKLSNVDSHDILHVPSPRCSKLEVWTKIPSYTIKHFCKILYFTLKYVYKRFVLLTNGNDVLTSRKSRKYNKLATKNVHTFAFVFFENGAPVIKASTCLPNSDWSRRVIHCYTLILLLQFITWKDGYMATRLYEALATKTHQSNLWTSEEFHASTSQTLIFCPELYIFLHFMWKISLKRFEEILITKKQC